MLIKQKIHQNREPVEYTDKELNTLMDAMVTVANIDIIPATANAVISTCMLGREYENRMLFVLLGVITTIATCAIFAMSPIIRIVLRHLDIQIPFFSGGTIKDSLIKWYTKTRYFVAMALMIVDTAFNIIIFVWLNRPTSGHSKSGLYMVLAFGVSSVVALVLWAGGSILAEHDDRADITIISEGSDDEI